MKTKGNLLVSAREILAVQNRRSLSENETLVYRTSLESHPLAPVSKDTVRAENKMYSMFITRLNENQTKMEVFFLMDPKGKVPVYLVNSMVDK